MDSTLSNPKHLSEVRVISKAHAIVLDPHHPLYKPSRCHSAICNINRHRLLLSHLLFGSLFETKPVSLCLLPYPCVCLYLYWHLLWQFAAQGHWHWLYMFSTLPWKDSVCHVFVKGEMGIVWANTIITGIYIKLQTGEHSHGPLHSTMKVVSSWESLTAGNLHSLQETPDVSLPLSFLFFFFVSSFSHLRYISLSPYCGEENWHKLCSKTKMVVFANYSSPFGPCIPDAANLVRRQI